jgi:hypothetical protein
MPAAIMLQTTAVVQPGCSGGGVVDGRGRLVGMVTGNARLLGGAVVPRLNFSLAVEQLRCGRRPTWKWDFNRVLGQLHSKGGP